MADAPGPSAKDDALWFVGMFAILVIVWYFAGGPGRADLRGLFLSPPSPLGTGEAYGPTFGDNASTTQSDQATTTYQTLEAPPSL